MNTQLPRALIVAHYDRDGIFDPHVLYSLQAYRQVFAHVTVVSASADHLPSGRESLADTFIARENNGYDFFSWKIGFNALADKDRFFEIVFVNDSIYGPLFDIEHVLLAPALKEADFWGLTSSAEDRRHIQSYFFAMRHRLLKSDAAQRFWDNVRPFKDKADVIKSYELQMAAYFRSRGWSVAAIYHGSARYPARWKTVRARDDLAQPLLLAKYCYHNWRNRAWRTRRQNPMDHHWRAVIETGVPFVKVELLRDNPLHLPLRPIHDYLDASTSYPSGLISAHLQRIARRPI